MQTGARMAVVAGVLVAVTCWMAYLGAAGSWRYYVTVDECLAASTELLHQPVRVSGRVADDSLAVDPAREEATFLLQGRDGQIRVTCRGGLPEGLTEGREVLVEGHLRSDMVEGVRVFTRCASKYSAASLPRGAPRPLGR